MSLSKKLKLLCQSQSNNCQDPDDVLKNNKAVVSSSSPNFHPFLNQQSFMLPFSGVKNSDIVRRVKSTSVPDVIKSCARSPPATNDNNTNNAVDGEYLLSYECSGESFSGSWFKDISSLRAPPASPPQEDIEKYNLKSVSCLQAKFQSIFPNFTHFNQVQSNCLEDLLGSNDPVVVSAPTGCGKTVVFELAIIKQLQELHSESMKIVYIAPVKALCSERFHDWKLKFTFLGLNILELTGDSDHEHLGVLKITTLSLQLQRSLIL